MLQEALLRGSEILARKEWSHDRAKFMNASEAHRCIRWQWYEKNGAEKDGPESWGFAKRGSHGEKYVVESLLAANLPLFNAGDDQVTLTDEKSKIAGTPDGILIYDDEMIPIEIKFIDPRTNRNYLPKPTHKAQLQLNMKLYELRAKADPTGDVFPVMPDGKPIRRGIIIYVDASNYDDVLECEIDPMDGDEWIAWVDRAKKLLRSKSDGPLNREGKVTGDCRLCPFKKACGVKLEASSFEKKRANRGSKLHDAAEGLLEIKASKALLADREKSLKEDIIAELHKRGSASAKVGDIEVSVTPVAGRVSVDWRKAEKAGLDLGPYKKEGAPSERLDVKRLVAS